MKNKYVLNLEDIPVKQAHMFNINKLNEFLAGKLEDFHEISKVGQFNAGQSNPTFVIEDSNHKRYVLRKKPPGKLLPSAHAVDREYKVQKALYNTSVPCPKMIALCEDSNIIGTPFYLMEYIEGNVSDSILEVKNVALRKNIFIKMAIMLANLHNISFEKAGLSDFGRPGNYAQRQISRWEKQWNLSKQRVLPEMDKIIIWLKKNIPPRCSSCIVHGDFRLGNLIYDENQTSINAVLDWELSTIGDPLADFGYMLYPYFLPIGERHGLKGIKIPIYGKIKPI